MPPKHVLMMVAEIDHYIPVLDMLLLITRFSFVVDFEDFWSKMQTEQYIERKM